MEPTGPRMPLAAWRAFARRVRHPAVTVTAPPEGIVFERDVEVVVRDGTILRVNVFRPAAPGRYPVIVSAHPYGKDSMPRPRPRGGYAIPRQYRLLGQSEPFSHSAWTSWEAPDPAFWVPRGYVVVNADLRGWGRSEGTGVLFSAQEGLDGHDLVEWAAAQEWSSGRVGMSGVSYLAITQWRIAATRPPHLAAITPWEGLTDLYRDFAMPGGIRETGFLSLWDTMLSLARRRPAGLRREVRRRPVIDDWWRQRDPDLERIDVPALVCGSFSDQSLHSRGSFEGFRRIGSTRRWLYTHRGPKWATYYSPEALAAQARFFDHFLAERPTGILDEPPVRVEVRSDRATVSAVTREERWPPADVTAVVLHADAATRSLGDRPADTAAALRARRGIVRLAHRFERRTDLIGPMRLRAHVSLERPDMTLFAGARKLSGGREVTFEGSYGFTGDIVAHGWLRASHRRVDAERSDTWEPFHPHASRDPVRPGQIVLLDLALLPSATRFEAGDELVLELRDRWFFPDDPIRGAFPARYTRTRSQRWTLHTGADTETTLLIPVRG